MFFKYFFTLLLLTFNFSIGIAHANEFDGLFAHERNIIKIFQKCSQRVVFVTRLKKTSSFKQRTTKIEPTGSGSGIIWNKQGFIVSNYHVIRGGDGIAITMGKLTVPAKLVYADPRKDLAVLRVYKDVALQKISNYTNMQIANSNSLFVGQTAIAIGNPYGLDHSLSVGVVSALKRQVPGAFGVRIHNMIQTDAAVNPGNSGGPLLDSSGKLIGINTAIFSKSGSSAGVGFAIPGDEVKSVVEQVVRTGKVKLAGIGVSPVDPKTTRRLGVERGVLIADVLPNSPAEHAKLRKTVKGPLGVTHVGDIIVAVAGKPVYNYDSLYSELAQMRIGQEFVLTVLRDKQQISHHMQTVDIAKL